jgi:hypothetical protein
VRGTQTLKRDSPGTDTQSQGGRGRGTVCGGDREDAEPGGGDRRLRGSGVGVSESGGERQRCRDRDPGAAEMGKARADSVRQGPAGGGPGLSMDQVTRPETHRPESPLAWLRVVLGGSPAGFRSTLSPLRNIP